MMEPVCVDGKSGKYRIMYRCTLCGVERWNKAAQEDDFEVLLKIAAEQKGLLDAS